MALQVNDNCAVSFHTISRLQNKYFILVVECALNKDIASTANNARNSATATNGRVDICSNETNGFSCPSSIYLPLRSPTTEKESADRSIDIDENEKSRPPSQIDGIIRDRIERREASTDPLSFNRVSLDVAGGRGRRASSSFGQLATRVERRIQGRANAKPKS